MFGGQKRRVEMIKRQHWLANLKQKRQKLPAASPRPSKKSDTLRYCFQRVDVLP